jgi:hypothetical protein
MGTSIELCIGNVSLSYSKNFIGVDYGFLFQEGDLFRRKTGSVNYNYYEENPEEKEELAEAEELFARTLFRILPRLEILGFTLEAARAEYQAVVAEAVEMASDSELEQPENEHLTFEEFCDLACRYPLGDLKNGYIEYETPDRDMLSQGRFAADIGVFRRIPWRDYSDLYWPETSFLSAKICILSAESMLQVFALNAANVEIEVTWEFGPIVHAGWVQREAFQQGTWQKQKILIATEGASDACIIRRSLDILRPDVADFFNFVDVDERHHFWGTGNLVKFAEGLLRIDVLNQVLFVFDNDAEGVSILDINGRAAAIECYLDLRLDQYPAPQVTWSNFKKDIDAWHGALEFKESYSKHFYDQPDGLLRNGSYDVSKLLILIDALILQAGLIVPVV